MDRVPTWRLELIDLLHGILSLLLVDETSRSAHTTGQTSTEGNGLVQGGYLASRRMARRSRLLGELEPTPMQLLEHSFRSGSKRHRA